MRRPRRQRPEELLQRHCVGVLRAYVPGPPDGPAWTAVNPVSAKSKAVAGISKAMGLRKGWPDLELLFRGRAIYVEVKAQKGGRVDADQKECHIDITAAGGAVYVIRTLDEFVAVLEREGIPCRLHGSGIQSAPQ